MRKKILCFGELMLRISPAPTAEQAAKQPMMLYMGGAEANVATALAAWDLPVKYCTVLPDNFMSRHVISYLEYKGIFTSSIVFAGNRIGLYYLERGADLKGNMVYDRDGSSFSTLKPGMIDWDKVLQDVDWFNFSAISPALNQNVADTCLEAVKEASKRGIKISVDLNYRSRLWKYGQSPVSIMTPLVEYCDVVMGNLWSADTLLGIDVDEHIHDKNSKQAYLDHSEQTSKAIISKFPRCKVVANTFRFDQEANHNFTIPLCTRMGSYLPLKSLRLKMWWTGRVVGIALWRVSFMGYSISTLANNSSIMLLPLLLESFRKQGTQPGRIFLPLIHRLNKTGPVSNH